MRRQDIIMALRILGGLIAALGLLAALPLLIAGLRLLMMESGGTAGLAAIFKAFAAAITSCFLAAIGFGFAELLEMADLALSKLNPAPSPNKKQEAQPTNDFAFEETHKTGRVQAYKRHIEQEPNVVIDTNVSQDDPAMPLGLRRLDEQAPEADAIATAFSCPWCNQPYEIVTGRNALFKCAKCGNDVLATFT